MTPVTAQVHWENSFHSSSSNAFAIDYLAAFNGRSLMKWCIFLGTGHEKAERIRSFVLFSLFYICFVPERILEQKRGRRRMNCTSSSGFFQWAEQVPVSFTEWKEILTKLNKEESLKRWFFFFPIAKRSFLSLRFSLDFPPRRIVRIARHQGTIHRTSRNKTDKFFQEINHWLVPLSILIFHRLRQPAIHLHWSSHDKVRRNNEHLSSPSSRISSRHSENRFDAEKTLRLVI